MKSKAMLSTSAVLTLGALAAFQAFQPAGPDCDYIKRKIDCSRLTAQECEAAQLEQDRYMLNLQSQCNRQEAEAAGGGQAGGNGGGAGGGAGSGSGSGASGGQGSAGEAAQQQPQESPAAQPAPNEGAEPEQQAQTPSMPASDPQQTQSSGARSPTADLGTASPLCNTARQALARATTEQQRTSMQAMVDKYCK